MKLRESSVEILHESNPYKLVERIGRICYKSEDRITEESYKKFVASLIHSKHYAMLEHGRITCKVVFENISEYVKVLSYLREGLFDVPCIYVAVAKYQVCTIYINFDLSHIYNTENLVKLKYLHCIKFLYDLRNAVEYNILDQETGPFEDASYSIEVVDYKDIKEELYAYDHEKFEHTSILFTCDRGVSHELVRHRCAVAQSSTRYCNYSLDKFGNEITFIYPDNYSSWTSELQHDFETLLLHSEKTYMNLISGGLKPQQARAVLPNALKTEVVLTMNKQQWKHFFDLRYHGTTGAPHPDMQLICGKLYDEFRNHDLL